MTAIVVILLVSCYSYPLFHTHARYTGTHQLLFPRVRGGQREIRCGRESCRKHVKRETLQSASLGVCVWGGATNLSVLRQGPYDKKYMPVLDGDRGQLHSKRSQEEKN